MGEIRLSSILSVQIIIVERRKTYVKPLLSDRWLSVLPCWSIVGLSRQSPLWRLKISMQRWIGILRVIWLPMKPGYVQVEMDCEGVVPMFAWKAESMWRSWSHVFLSPAFRDCPEKRFLPIAWEVLTFRPWAIPAYWGNDFDRILSGRLTAWFLLWMAQNCLTVFGAMPPSRAGVVLLRFHQSVKRNR